MKLSRKEAIKSGDAFYKTDKKCIHGHYSKRQTVDGSCYECRMEKQREHRALVRKNILNIHGI